MLPKRQKLSVSEVQEVLRAGRSVREGPISMKYTLCEGPSKVAVVVPKSVAKAATARNYLRRVVYHILRTLSLPKHKHLVFFVQKKSERAILMSTISKLCSQLS